MGTARVCVVTNFDLHPDLRLSQLAIGAERAPLPVIDNFVANAEALVADACARPFTVRSRYFPGIRAEGSARIPAAAAHTTEECATRLSRHAGTGRSRSPCATTR